MQVLTGDEMRKVDSCCIEDIGMPGTMLMENAGRAVATRIMHHYDRGQQILVLTGSGNNGGDGFVIARMLKAADYDIRVCVIPEVERIKGDADFHRTLYEKAGYSWTDYDKTYIEHSDVIVDAMLGTGVSGEIRSPYLEIIQDISESGKTVVAVDVPSGVPGDGSVVPKGAIEAHRTIILEKPKLSYYTYPGRENYGEAEVVSIGIPPKAFSAAVDTKRRVWTERDMLEHWPDRSTSSHKGSHGKVGIAAGSDMMPGAAALTVGAAVKSGAGLTTVNTTKSVISTISNHVPEATYFSRNDALDDFMEGKDCIAVGPGLGLKRETEEMTRTLIENFDGPLVIDADSLHSLNKMKDAIEKREHPLIITPHPGEMANLIDSTPKEVNENRFETAEKFAREYGIYVVLKGPCTLIATPEGETWINDTGNAGLAKGGSGDVLTGMILAFTGRYKDIQAAVSSAVYVHGFTADYLLDQGVAVETMTAKQIIDALPHSFTAFHMNTNVSPGK